jgi:hypothetical protein
MPNSLARRSIDFSKSKLVDAGYSHSDRRLNLLLDAANSAAAACQDSLESGLNLRHCLTRSAIHFDE